MRELRRILRWLSKKFFYRELIIANSFYDLAHGNIIRDQLVGYLSGTCRVSLWGEFFRSGNNQITVLQLVGFAQQEVAEEFFQMFQFRFNAAGIVAVVGSHRSIAEVPNITSKAFFISQPNICQPWVDVKKRLAVNSPVVMKTRYFKRCYPFDWLW